MGFFSSKKKINSDEYEKLSKRFTDLESEIDKLTSKFMSLRGLIHRKFTGDLEPTEDLEKEKEIDDGLDELRDLKRKGI